MIHHFIPLFLLVTVLFSEDCIPKEDTANIWYRLAPSDSTETFELLPIDMSYGFVGADPLNVYILVFTKDTREKILMTFPNGDWFDASMSVGEKRESMPPKKEEEHMKQTKDKGLKIEKRYN